ncbi:AraC family transcriptional regulator [Alteromonas sediminis]|uniref:AraC family transcriptional regulator n=1 Tax=Alteromonas sediminis TaxID=2259342 RepID=A0A3N5Z8K9_9ALTE|nr:AraC family transcriptional regulator [Alteromonas sediminis]RPJ65368.1 AraC family transcriptional regulator [Alteromonas sediminis]
MDIAAKKCEPAIVSSQKLIFIAESMRELNIDLSTVFPKTHLENQRLVAMEERVPFSLVKEVFEKLAQLPIENLAITLGSMIRVKYYGLFGCVLLCKEDLRSAMEFAIGYHDIVTRTTELSFAPAKDGYYKFCCHSVFDQPLLQHFNLEFHAAVNLSLIRDVVDNRQFSPCEVHMSVPKPANPAFYEAYFGCPVRFEQAEDFLLFSHEKVATKLPQNNPLVVPILLKDCEQQIRDYLSENDFLFTVYKWVSENIHRDATLEMLAKTLCTTERTLRRKLAEYNVTFSEISTNIKQKLAKQYLTETQLTVDDIGAAIGFTDPANFRRAFKRWSGMQPSQFRKLSGE